MANMYEKRAISNNDSYSFTELNSGALEHIPKCSGIYKVYMPDNFTIKFRADSDSPYKVYDVDILQKKWATICKYPEYEDGLLYIGKAVNLYRRIKQFVDTGYGIPANHKGGRAIFQLENNKQLLIKIFECENYEDRETEEIDTYIRHRNEKPLANWRRGTKKSKK